MMPIHPGDRVIEIVTIDNQHVGPSPRRPNGPAACPHRQGDGTSRFGTCPQSPIQQVWPAIGSERLEILLPTLNQIINTLRPDRLVQVRNAGQS